MRKKKLVYVRQHALVMENNMKICRLTHTYSCYIQDFFVYTTPLYLVFLFFLYKWKKYDCAHEKSTNALDIHLYAYSDFRSMATFTFYQEKEFSLVVSITRLRIHTYRRRKKKLKICKWQIHRLNVILIYYQYVSRFFT